MTAMNANLEKFKVADKVNDGPPPGGDHLRASAGLTSPEANDMIKAMNSGGPDSKALAAFAGKGDCEINDPERQPKASSNAFHTVSGERFVETIVGNDTRYTTTAENADSAKARELANQQASQYERA